MRDKRVDLVNGDIGTLGQVDHHGRGHLCLSTGLAGLEPRIRGHDLRLQPVNNLLGLFLQLRVLNASEELVRLFF